MHGRSHASTRTFSRSVPLRTFQVGWWTFNNISKPFFCSSTFLDVIFSLYSGWAWRTASWMSTWVLGDESLYNVETILTFPLLALLVPKGGLMPDFCESLCLSFGGGRVWVGVWSAMLLNEAWLQYDWRRHDGWVNFLIELYTTLAGFQEDGR